MLVIDKKDDIKTLSSIGATQNLVKSIFLAEGLLVATIGVVLGLILGLSISFFQQKFGLIKLGMEYALVDAYPVEIRSADVIMSVLGIFVISVLASIVPASRATKFMINN
jgi:lipoprotein-releasing system permease protein